MSASTIGTAESPSCGYSGSEEVVEELRKVTKERNLKGKIRVVRSAVWMSALSAPI